MRTDGPVPEPPFLGAKVVESIKLEALLPYINESVLFKFQWQFKQRGMAKEEFARFAEREIRPVYLDVIDKCKEQKILQPQAVYGYFECQSDGDDVIVYHPQSDDVLHRFSLLVHKSFAIDEVDHARE